MCVAYSSVTAIIFKLLRKLVGLMEMRTNELGFAGDASRQLAICDCYGQMLLHGGCWSRATAQRLPLRQSIELTQSLALPVLAFNPANDLD